MEKLFLLDSNSLINRAYYALPDLTNRTGQHTGAIFGFIAMLLKLITDYRPTHMIATFDRKAPTFRRQQHDFYKAKRKPMPPELASQLEPLKEILRAMEIPIVEADGYEADDLIGTLAKHYDWQTYIVTGDKDSLQLIDDTTTVLLTKKGISEIVRYDRERLAQEGLTPPQIVDLKSLMGDSSDNIPGVPGVGEKTARVLIGQYGSMEGVYEHLDELKGKLKEKLEQNRELARISYELATIDTRVPIAFDPKQAELTYPFPIAVKERLIALEFAKFAERMEFAGEACPAATQKTTDTILISTREALDEAIERMLKAGKAAFTIGKEVGFCSDEETAYTVAISDGLFDEGISFDTFIEGFRRVLESESVVKYVFDGKAVLHLLDEYGTFMAGAYEDVLLKAYLCDANRNYKSIEELTTAYQTGERPLCAALLEIDAVCEEDMTSKGLQKLYRDLELPLERVLYDMECQGFCVDRAVLDEINVKLTEELSELSAQIIEMAGKSFNINSPKQLAEVLFEDLGLKSGKKNKQGYSTSVEVLEGLRSKHPIIGKILRFREIGKLKSTYLDGMAPLIDASGAIHTVFKQTVTSTGRLSSTEPNLQNIPVRRAEGRQIRRMFVPRKGNVLVCADYSQIELRLMAAFSKDATMIDAFRRGVDIHATTAAQVLGIPLESVTPDLRRQAKAVNFGIIYGISDFGLSEDLGIAVWQARDFIERYFTKYPDVKRYMDQCVEEGKRDGYVTTILGRRREIPELKSSNFNLRKFGERVAMNMPLQGSASDIIKLAMLAVHRTLGARGLKSKLIMQVHDELLVDTVPNEAEEVKAILRECMQNAVELDVPLIADCGQGANWLEAK